MDSNEFNLEYFIIKLILLTEKYVSFRLIITGFNDFGKIRITF